MNLFENASRVKLRFKTSKGELATEDLWGLSLQSLDRVGKTVKVEAHEAASSMLPTTEKIKGVLKLKLDIVKYIIIDKMDKKGAPVKIIDEPEEIL